MGSIQMPRTLLASILLLFLLGGAASADVNAFVYHRFGDGRYPSTNISLEAFEAQLAFLKEKGYTVLALGEVVRRLRGGEPLPERSALLTVDDGYLTFLTGAMPLLRRYGYPVTLFVSTGSVGHKGYLDWEQLRSLAAEGVEIGNHSHGHDYLLEDQPGEGEGDRLLRVRKDLLRAQELFGRELGRRPTLFAYPFGEFSPEIVTLVREIGFEGAVGQQSGVIFGGSDLFNLPRFPMGGPFATLEGFRDKVRMKALPVIEAEPASPLVGAEDPPLLRVKIAPGEADLSRLRCFVQGQEDAVVTVVPGETGSFIVKAGKPLAGRRNKYTLTAPAATGGGWYWYSHLWVKTGRKE